jgi:hypothetical protein
MLAVLPRTILADPLADYYLERAAEHYHHAWAILADFGEGLSTSEHRERLREAAHHLGLACRVLDHAQQEVHQSCDAASLQESLVQLQKLAAAVAGHLYREWAADPSYRLGAREEGSDADREAERARTSI